jgi:hypothetical protein
MIVCYVIRFKIVTDTGNLYRKIGRGFNYTERGWNEEEENGEEGNVYV